MNIKLLKSKIPFLVTLACCVTVAALAAGVRSADSEKAAAVTTAGSSPRKVIVLDAGHPTYLNTQTPRIWLNQAV